MKVTKASKTEANSTLNGMKIVSVPCKKIRFAPYNPKDRTDKRNLSKLMASMKQYGLLVPVLLKEDFGLIEGHRRVASAMALKWESIPAIVTNADGEVLYREIGDNVKRMGNRDTLGIWLKEPKAVPNRASSSLFRIEEEIGRPLLQKIYDKGLSHRVYYVATRLSKYCETTSKDFLIDAIHWLLKFRIIGDARKAMDQQESPLVIRKAINQMKPIALKLAVA